MDAGTGAIGSDGQPQTAGYHDSTTQETRPGREAGADHSGAGHSGMPAWAPRLIVFVAVMAVAVFASLAVLSRLRGFIGIMVLSLFLPLAIEPGVNWFAKHRWTRFWATSFIMLLVILLFAGLALAFIPMFVSQFGQLGTFVGDVLERLNPYLNEWFGTEFSFETVKQIGPSFADLGLSAVGGLLGAVGSVVGFVASFMAIAFFTFFFVLDGPKLRRYLFSFMKPEQQKTVVWTWDVAIRKTGGYLYSRVPQAAITGVGAYIVLRILGIPFALPLAVWSGVVSQFIPAVGSYLAAVLPLLITVFISPTKFLILGAYYLIYQGVENYFLGPKIYGKTMELHPAVALGSAFVGGALFGVAGAFLALPVAAVIQAGITTYSTRYEVMESDLTRDEGDKPPRQQREGTKWPWVRHGSEKSEGPSQEVAPRETTGPKDQP